MLLFLKILASFAFKKYKTKALKNTGLFIFFLNFICDVRDLYDVRGRGHVLFSHRYTLFLHVPEVILFFRDAHGQYMKSASTLPS